MVTFDLLAKIHRRGPPKPKTDSNQLEIELAFLLYAVFSKPVSVSFLQVRKNASRRGRDDIKDFSTLDQRVRFETNALPHFIFIFLVPKFDLALNGLFGCIIWALLLSLCMSAFPAYAAANRDFIFPPSDSVEKNSLE